MLSYVLALQASRARAVKVVFIQISGAAAELWEAAAGRSGAAAEVWGAAAEMSHGLGRFSGADFFPKVMLYFPKVMLSFPRGRAVFLR